MTSFCLAVEGETASSAGVVLPDVDQRVLLGELRQARLGARPCRPGRRAHHDRFQCRRGELTAGRARRRGAPISVADLDSSEAPQLARSGRQRTDAPDGPRRARTRRSPSTLPCGCGPTALNRRRSRTRMVPENIRT